MAHHFTKNTIEASYWCAKCHKETMHRVDNGLRGPCLECLKKPTPAPKPPPAKQEELF